MLKNFPRTPFTLAAARRPCRKCKIQRFKRPEMDFAPSWFPNGRTALYIASSYGHSEVVKELIAAGAKVDVQEGEDGDTALHIARENGRLKVVKELIAAGANVAPPSRA
ncbi:Eye-specific diacylglycerol kinase [Diplonema papillatum]|nr:Eye-specific diacylglycerol kinase [Diplonema papillatum]